MFKKIKSAVSSVIPLNKNKSVSSISTSLSEICSEATEGKADFQRCIRNPKKFVAK